MNNMQGFADILERQTQILEGLVGAVDARKEADRTKAPANFSTYTPLHGPGGIWTDPALERDVITAHVRPFGISARLPLIATVNVAPQFGVLTGFTAVNGDEPDYACEDAPSGYSKGCTLSAQFGLLRRDTQTIDLDDVMLKLHRGDHTDLMLRGQVLGLTNLNPSVTNQADILNLVTASEMVTVGVNVERELSRRIWQGSTALGQMPGLDSQIATGQLDFKTNTLCPAVDSDVKDFALDEIGGSGRDIVEYVQMLEYYLRYNAMTMGLDPVEWVVVMRPELWFELSSVWPCAYNTNKCSNAMTGTNSRLFIDGRENVAERDAMRNGMYIDINGNRYQVVLDTGIYEHNNINNAGLQPGEYASTIYFVPLTIVGGMPVTYREYLDFRQAARDMSATQGRPDVWWTDNGVYSWSITQEKWCFKLHVKTEQRVILRAPHLAGRIDNVKYVPLQHLRESYPDSAYFHDGGVSLRSTDTSGYAVWLS